MLLSIVLLRSSFVNVLGGDSEILFFGENDDSFPLFVLKVGVSMVDFSVGFSVGFSVVFTGVIDEPKVKSVGLKVFDSEGDIIVLDGISVDFFVDISAAFSTGFSNDFSTVFSAGFSVGFSFVLMKEAKLFLNPGDSSFDFSVGFSVVFSFVLKEEAKLLLKPDISSDLFEFAIGKKLLFDSVIGDFDFSFGGE